MLTAQDDGTETGAYIVCMTPFRAPMQDSDCLWPSTVGLALACGATSNDHRAV